MRTLAGRRSKNCDSTKYCAPTVTLAVTSANRSGNPETMNDVDAASMFGLDVAVYLRGDAPGGTASTTVDVRFDEPILLRPGPLDLGI